MNRKAFTWRLRRLIRKLDCIEESHSWFFLLKMSMSRFYINRSDSPRSTRSAPWSVWGSTGPPRNSYSSHSPRSVRSAGPQVRLTHAKRSSSVESQSSNDSRPCRRLVGNWWDVCCFMFLFDFCSLLLCFYLFIFSWVLIKKDCYYSLLSKMTLIFRNWIFGVVYHKNILLAPNEGRKNFSSKNNFKS